MTKESLEFLKTNLALSIYYGFFCGLLFGLMLSIMVVALRLLDQFISDIFLISFYLTALCVFIGLVAGLIFALIIFPILSLRKAKPNREKLSRIYKGVIIAFTLFIIGEVLWIEINRPMSFVQAKIFFGSLIIVIASIIAAVLIDFGLSFAKRHIKIYSRAANFLVKKKGISIISFIILTILLPSLYFSLCQIKRVDVKSPSEYKELLTTKSDLRVLLIGLDGATWHVMQPLLEEGKLPNIATLMRQGSSGVLQSYPALNMPFSNSASQGMRSPQVWESIATSKKPTEHGIWDFTVTLIPGIKNPFAWQSPFLPSFLSTKPVSSNMVRQRNIWEILGSLGRPSVVVGWFNTWPAPPSPGTTVVSSYLFYGAKGSVYPLRIEKEIKEYIYTADDFENEEFYRFMNFDYNKNYREFDSDSIKYQENNFARIFRNDYAKDKSLKQISLYLWNKYKPSLLAVRFNQPDSAQHTLWKYMEPKYFPDVNDDGINKFGNTIYQTYILLDSYIGEFIKYADENTIIMILSDHGFGPWVEEETKFLPKFPGKAYHPNYTGNHRRNGIIIISGKGVKHNHKISNSTIFDITPTILWLMKLSLALDMEGQPLIESFTDQSRIKLAIKYTNTYGIRETGDRRPISSGAEKEIEERLKSLGYIQ
jgi:predicted AlkP superfamily phosphohydrolase/phosphomutase